MVEYLTAEIRPVHQFHDNVLSAVQEEFWPDALPDGTVFRYGIYYMQSATQTKVNKSNFTRIKPADKERFKTRLKQSLAQILECN